MLDLDDIPAPPEPLEPVIYAGRDTLKRLRVRRVDEVALAARAREAAVAQGKWKILIQHGGGVANAYKYPADTEAALAVASPTGCVVVWMNRLPANKVTLGGAASKCLPGSRALFDDRYGETAKEAARKRIQSRHRELFPQTAHERLLSDDLFEGDAQI